MVNYDAEIKLSICIPTYNRARFLEETLESVTSQVNDNVEVVVVDGASTDNTAEVAERYRKKIANLVYYRGEKRLGVDRDMAKTIEISRGMYCWLLSDDDLLKPGAIKRILKEIASGYEIYLCNITACNLFLKPYKEIFWLSPRVKDRVFNFCDRNELLEYLGKANSIGALFSYMSSIVLRRQEWNRVGYNYDFDGTAYALASSLFSFTKLKCRLKYIRNSLVLWRNDNDSFQHVGGLTKRFLLDFDGYLRLADKYFADDLILRCAFLKVMRREHPWYTVIHAASFIDNHESWRQFKSKLLAFGYSHAMIALIHFFAKNKQLVSVAVKIKRKIVRSGIYLRINKNNNATFADDEII